MSKITDFAPVSAIDGTEVLYAVKNSLDKSVTTTALKDYFNDVPFAPIDWNPRNDASATPLQYLVQNEYVVANDGVELSPTPPTQPVIKLHTSLEAGESTSHIAIDESTYQITINPKTSAGVQKAYVAILYPEFNLQNLTTLSRVFNGKLHFVKSSGYSPTATQAQLTTWLNGKSKITLNATVGGVGVVLGSTGTYVDSALASTQFPVGDIVASSFRISAGGIKVNTKQTINNNSITEFAATGVTNILTDVMIVLELDIDGQIAVENKLKVNGYRNLINCSLQIVENFDYIIPAGLVVSVGALNADAESMLVIGSKSVADSRLEFKGLNGNVFVPLSDINPDGSYILRMSGETIRIKTKQGWVDILTSSAVRTPAIYLNVSVKAYGSNNINNRLEYDPQDLVSYNLSIPGTLPANSQDGDWLKVTGRGTFAGKILDVGDFVKVSENKTNLIVVKDAAEDSSKSDCTVELSTTSVYQAGQHLVLGKTLYETSGSGYVANSTDSIPVKFVQDTLTPTLYAPTNVPADSTLVFAQQFRTNLKLDLKTIKLSGLVKPLTGTAPFTIYVVSSFLDGAPVIIGQTSGVVNSVGFDEVDCVFSSTLLIPAKSNFWVAIRANNGFNVYTAPTQLSQEGNILTTTGKVVTRDSDGNYVESTGPWGLGVNINAQHRKVNTLSETSLHKPIRGMVNADFNDNDLTPFKLLSSIPRNNLILKEINKIVNAGDVFIKGDFRTELTLAGLDKALTVPASVDMVKSFASFKLLKDLELSALELYFPDTVDETGLTSVSILDSTGQAVATSTQFLTISVTGFKRVIIYIVVPLVIGTYDVELTTTVEPVLLASSDVRGDVNGLLPGSDTIKYTRVNSAAVEDVLEDTFPYMVLKLASLNTPLPISDYVAGNCIPQIRNVTTAAASTIAGSDNINDLFSKLFERINSLEARVVELESASVGP